MKTKPFFSVIIATYNRKQLLQRALRSLLNQTETDWEGIVIDDGSTDDTFDVVRAFQGEIPGKIRYLNQPNLGVVAAKNMGMSCAIGRYITFLDSDDTYKSIHLSNRRKILTETDSIDFLHGGVEIIGSSYVPDVQCPDKQIHLSKCAISGTFFIKSSWIDKLSFAGDSLGTDANFMECAKRTAMHIVKTDAPTYVYHRDILQSITNDFGVDSAD